MHLSITDSHFRWIKQWDIELQREKRCIALTLDNWRGHRIQYKPKCIELIRFGSGLTSRIQPLDAGIIYCFKAYYRIKFCHRAID